MRWTDDEIRELVALWPTLSAIQIARRLQRPRTAICRKAQRLRLDGVRPRGEKKSFEMKLRPYRHAPALATAEPTVRLQKPLHPNLVSLQMPCSFSN